LTLSEERQRKQIATDLHDTVIQMLAMSKIKLSETRKSISCSDHGKQLDEISGLIEQAIHEARTLTFELSPPILHELGFVPAVEWLTEQFQQQHGTHTCFKATDKLKPLDNDILIVLFRAVRELLINIAKHANAQAVTVGMAREGDEAKIHISDDGVGFDISDIESHVESTNGFGLFSIRERLDYLGGRLDIESAPGHGTRVTLVAPLGCDGVL
jgi:signal transduction histidine kinase